MWGARCLHRAGQAFWVQPGISGRNHQPSWPATCSHCHLLPKMPDTKFSLGYILGHSSFPLPTPRFLLAQAPSPSPSLSLSSYWIFSFFISHFLDGFTMQDRLFTFEGCNNHSLCSEQRGRNVRVTSYLTSISSARGTRGACGLRLAGEGWYVLGWLGHEAAPERVLSLKSCDCPL